MAGENWRLPQPDHCSHQPLANVLTQVNSLHGKRPQRSKWERRIAVMLLCRCKRFISRR